MATLFIPRAGEILQLAAPWTFNLRAEPGNSAAWVGFGLHLKYPDIMKEQALEPAKRRRVLWQGRATAIIESVTLPAGIKLFTRRVRVQSWWRGMGQYARNEDELAFWIRREDNLGVARWFGQFTAPLADVNGMEVV